MATVETKRESVGTRFCDDHHQHMERRDRERVRDVTLKSVSRTDERLPVTDREIDLVSAVQDAQVILSIADEEREQKLVIGLMRSLLVPS